MLKLTKGNVYHASVVVCKSMVCGREYDLHALSQTNIRFDYHREQYPSGIA